MLEIIKFLFWPIFFFIGTAYAKYQGRKNEKSKIDSMLLDDVITAKKSDNDIDNLTDIERSKRMLFFSREERKRSGKK